MGSETMKQSTRLSARLSEKRPEVNSAGQYPAGVSLPFLINQVHQLGPDLANPRRIIIAPSLISFSTETVLGPRFPRLRSINQSLSPSSQRNIRLRPTSTAVYVLPLRAFNIYFWGERLKFNFALSELEYFLLLS